MSLYQPFRFFDPSQIPQNILWMGISWAIQFGFKKLLQKHPIKITRHQIWRNFQWFKIMSHAVCMICCMHIGTFWKYMGLKTVENQFVKIMFFNLTYGFEIFRKLEPQVAELIITKLREWLDKKNSLN